MTDAIPRSMTLLYGAYESEQGCDFKTFVLRLLDDGDKAGAGWARQAQLLIDHALDEIGGHEYPEHWDGDTHVLCKHCDQGTSWFWIEGVHETRTDDNGWTYEEGCGKPYKMRVPWRNRDPVVASCCGVTFISTNKVGWECFMPPSEHI